MQTPKPGQIVTTFTTKNGLAAELRYPTIDDAPALLEFINTFSRESNFTRFAGEQMTLADEVEYLKSQLALVAAGDEVKLFCFVNGKMAGTSDVTRDIEWLTRRRHIGIFGVILGADFRGQGIGEKLMSTVIEEAQSRLQGMRMIELQCFATNATAMALYKKMGFTEVGRIPQALLHNGEYVDEVVMVRMLPNVG